MLHAVVGAAWHVLLHLRPQLFVERAALVRKRRVRGDDALPLARRQHRVELLGRGLRIGAGFDREIADRSPHRPAMDRRQRREHLHAHLLVELRLLLAELLEELSHGLVLIGSLGRRVRVLGERADRRDAKRKRQRENRSVHSAILT